MSCAAMPTTSPTVFGPEPGKKHGYCGHEEIELALVKLCAAHRRAEIPGAGEILHRPARPAAALLRRGGAARAAPIPRHYHFKTYEYNQSHMPVREQDKVVGHAVRAMYLYSGMADIATEYGDDSLTAALRPAVGRSHHQAPLRHRRARAVGAQRGLHHRLRPAQRDRLCRDLRRGRAGVLGAAACSASSRDARYADMMERALYNGAICGPVARRRAVLLREPAGKPGRPSPLEMAPLPVLPAQYRAPDRLDRQLRLLAGADDAGRASLRQTRPPASRSAAPVSLSADEPLSVGWRVEIAVEPETPVEFTLHLRIPAGAARAGWRSTAQALDWRSRHRRRLCRDPAALAEGRPRHARSRHADRAALRPSRGAAGYRPRRAEARTADLLRRGDRQRCADASLALPRSNPSRRSSSAICSAAWRPHCAGAGGSTVGDGALYRTEPPAEPSPSRPFHTASGSTAMPGEMSVWIRESDQRSVDDQHTSGNNEEGNHVQSVKLLPRACRARASASRGRRLRPADDRRHHQERHDRRRSLHHDADLRPHRQERRARRIRSGRGAAPRANTLASKSSSCRSRAPTASRNC